MAPLVCSAVNVLRLTVAACSADECTELCSDILAGVQQSCPQLLAGAYGVLFEQMAAVCAHATTSSTVI